jgi:hypothetical protein
MSPLEPCRDDDPVATTTAPDEPVVSPVNMDTLPEEPDGYVFEAAEPLATTTPPELPLLAVPLLNSKEPLTPAHAFAERITTRPEDAAVPLPLATNRLPPERCVSDVEPPTTRTFAPTVSDPLPATTDIAPDPLVLLPVAATTSPVKPALTDPDRINTAPEAPDAVTPPEATYTAPLSPDTVLPLLKTTTPVVP